MIYLASPYSHESVHIRRLRYRMATQYAAECIITRQECVFSPIVYAHDMAELFNLPFDAATWAGFNDEMQKACSTLRVLKLPGWEESKGVTAEIALAESLGQQIEYVEAAL